MNNLVKENGAKAPNSLAMEEMLNGVKDIINLRMVGYNEMVEKNDPSEEKRISELSSIAEAVIGIATHIKDKMPTFDFVFDENGKTIVKKLWLEKNGKSED